MPDLDLSLVRHAQAGFPRDQTLGDHERVLTEEGEEEALAMAEYLRSRSFAPDLVWTSTARRALATAHHFAQVMEWPPSTVMAREDLYLPEPFDLLQAVRSCDEAVRHLVVVGHNPGLEALWGWLCGVKAPSLPTCGVVLIRLTVETWREVDQGRGEVMDFLSPRTLIEGRL